MSFEIITVIVVIGIFVLFGIGAIKADKTINQMSNQLQSNNDAESKK